MEPGLFKKVTGLDVSDFDLLISLGVFNGPLMNDAVYKFKRYEDASLSYAGINKHDYDANIGLWDTIITKQDYKDMFKLQQASLGVSLKSLEEDEKKKDIKKVRLNIKTYDDNQKTPIEKIKDKKVENVDYKGKVENGMEIGHKKFGLGLVTNIEDGKIFVEFKKGEKIFQFPEAFEMGFLKLE